MYLKRYLLSIRRKVLLPKYEVSEKRVANISANASHKCDYYGNSCPCLKCKFEEKGNKKNCGLFCTLDLIKKAKEQFLDSRNKELIRSFEKGYLEAVGKFPESGGRGRATGKAFEEWVKQSVGLNDKKGGNVIFDFGFFNVDLAVPSKEEPVKAILEIKKNPSLQDALAVKGLLDFSGKNPNRKVGFVVLSLLSREDGIEEILKKTKEKYGKRFDYFIINKGWKDIVESLKEFLES